MRKEEMFQLDDYESSHMPFAAPGEGEERQLCCLKVNGVWKIHYFDGSGWRRLFTGANEDATECCPTAEWHPDYRQWTVSFIAGGSVMNGWRDVGFMLYRKWGFDDTPPVKVCPANVGYVWKRQATFASSVGPIIQYEGSMKTVTKLKGVDYIYRLSYDPFSPRDILMSLQKKDGSLVSCRWSPLANGLTLITDGGEPCYKCAVWRDGVYYCRRRDGGGFEERRIVKAESLELTPADPGTLIESVEVTEAEEEL